MKKLTASFFFENFWRLLTNVWSFLFIVIIVANFFSLGSYGYLITPFAIIYGAVLSIFVGTKEFARWYVDRPDDRHPGEVFVILWSLVMVGMAVISWVWGEEYRISSDVISSYIMILTVFALTQASKQARNYAKKGKR
jgi:hypothetical protein